ncbi:MAG: N-acetylmuramoyl-L-alanine amidase, partial [Hydrogenimonas sp.]|nr:N-acetylmuramoyl-L-alanine amidase [Hydrogenimonas sp.]
MKALLDQNRTLQEKALLGLIKASKILGLDPTRYKNALKTIRPDLLNKSKKVEKKSPKKVTASIESYPTAAKKAKLLEAKVERGRLKLAFTKGVTKRQIKHFILERKGKILYVFDFKNIMIPFSIKRFRGASFKEIRIAQFDPKRVRVVIEVKKPYKPKLEFKEKTLYITLPHAKTEAAKSSLPKHETKRKTVGKESQQNIPKFLRRYTVVIDPGHGGKDAGAVGVKRKKEKDAVLAVAKRLKRVLEERGFKVYMTREKDIFIPLRKRTHFANKKGADFFISLHANAAAKKGSRYKSKGLETYFLSPARSERAKRVAALENSADISDLNRYTKSTYLNVLNREKIIESNKLAIDLQKQILLSLRNRYKGVVD